jgi:hypothetical protein
MSLSVSMNLARFGAKMSNVKRDSDPLEKVEQTAVQLAFERKWASILNATLDEHMNGWVVLNMLFETPNAPDWGTFLALASNSTYHQHVVLIRQLIDGGFLRKDPDKDNDYKLSEPAKKMWSTVLHSAVPLQAANRGDL